MVSADTGQETNYKTREWEDLHFFKVEKYQSSKLNAQKRSRGLLFLDNWLWMTLDVIPTGVRFADSLEALEIIHNYPDGLLQFSE